MSDRVLVLSAGPASHPIADFPVTLERPRSVADIRTTPAFTKIYGDIWSVLLQPSQCRRHGIRRRRDRRVSGLGRRRRLPDPAGCNDLRHEQRDARILVLTAFALIIDRCVTGIEKRLMRWQPAQ